MWEHCGDLSLLIPEVLKSPSWWLHKDKQGSVKKSKEYKGKAPQK
jgi:hypothetical protein